MFFAKRIALVLLLMCGLISTANAVVSFTRTDPNLNLAYATFIDYPPFGEYAQKQVGHNSIKEIFTSVFANFAKKFFGEKDVNYKVIGDTDYLNLVRRVRAGEADILFGAYHNTKLYDGLDYIMPAIIDNPVILIMLPQNVGKVKSLEDLKKLKGAVLTKDKFSDFVQKELKKYNLSYEESTLEIYRKLFTGEIDFIFATYYFGIAETANLGLLSKVSIAKQPIWNMPLFIAVAKSSKHHSSIMQSMTQFIGKEENRKLIEDEMKATIRAYEQKSLKIAPPVFTK